MKGKNVIAFDLEGPLSPMDHAMEVIGLVPEGRKVFAVLSRYDDLLTLENRAGYEPGDTLVLIIPFLLSHQIKPEDMIAVSEKAGLVKGSEELITQLENDDWDVYIISTSYCQHALSIGKRLGIKKDNISCTDLKKIWLNKKLDEEVAYLLRETEEYILLNLYSDRLDSGEKDEAIKPYLDRFFWDQLKDSSIGPIMNEIKVMGGRRKRDAIANIAKRNGISLKETVVVGDSITDFQMLKAVNEAEGLAVVFNGNEFCLPYGGASVASTDLRDIRFLTDIWLKNGLKGVKKAVLENLRQKPELQEKSDGPYYHWLRGIDKEEINKILKLHKTFRKKVRGEITARLG